MDASYLSFARSDRLFYDKPHLGSDGTPAFMPAPHATWEGWSHSGDDTWSFWTPPSAQLPEQGWKIHVSATPDTAEVVLEAASVYCHRKALPFKFLRNRTVLAATLSKDGDRRFAGKFITIYPATDSHLHTHLTELDTALRGSAGPYVLSDLRWKAGPVYVRYGAFTRHVIDVGGVDVPAIRDLDSGALVPDVRTAGFHVPPWVTVPEFLQAQIDLLGTQPPHGFPRISGALQFSNAGGVYEGEVDGGPVILKEARPNVGWTPDGRNAIQRLHDEAAVLRSLNDRIPTPRLLATYVAHGHHFLAMERIQARSLSAEVVARNPLTRADCSLHARITYRDWALRVACSLRRAIHALHRIGRTHGDLHPGNVLVQSDDTIVLIDFEMSRQVTDDEPVMIGAPGFVAADGRNALGQDLYALTCIELFMFLPLTSILQVQPAKASMFLRQAAREFDLDEAWVQRHLNVVSPRSESIPSRETDSGSHAGRRGADMVDDIVQTLLSDATPDRQDRLWPGDPSQFGEPATSIAHGALGVLAALHGAGVEPAPSHLAWVDEAVLRSEAPTRLGLFNGLAGAVWAYRRMGLEEQADRRLSELRNATHDSLGVDLYGGLPGLGLTLVAESRRHRLLLDKAVSIARELRSRWRATAPQSQVPTGRGGLLHGATGTALFALRLYELTGDPKHLDLAAEAIDHDLASLVRAADGSLQVNEGWRVLPYLGNGSAGIGIVLAQLIAHLPGHSRYLETIDGIALACTAPFTALSGLFQGRAGIVQFLLELDRSGLGTAGTSAALEDHIADLELHAVQHDDQLRFVGDGLLRTSCDLATGAAGILATLVDYRTWKHQRRVDRACLPYLTPLRAVEIQSPLTAARARQGGEMNGLPLVPASA